jgi:hypothetical protein
MDKLGAKAFLLHLAESSLTENATSPFQAGPAHVRLLLTDNALVVSSARKSALDCDDAD